MDYIWMDTPNLIEKLLVYIIKLYKKINYVHALIELIFLFISILKKCTKNCCPWKWFVPTKCVLFLLIYFILKRRKVSKQNTCISSGPNYV